MFLRMIKRSFSKGLKSKLLAIVAIAFGASLATAMFSVSLDIGDKINNELKSYGSNIVVLPESESLPVEINGVDFSPITQGKSYIKEEDIPKIKMTFWRNNIVNLAPYLEVNGQIDNEKIAVVGTWFNRKTRIPTGEKFNFGVKHLKSWWQVQGDWIKDGGSDNSALIGREIANAYNLNPGDRFKMKFDTNDSSVTELIKVQGVINSGGKEESKVYLPLDFLQKTVGLEGKVEEIEVSALTTPVNELARKAQANPDSLSNEEFERWYCTAYISSIAYQIEEVIPGVVAKEVRQISRSEGVILNKIKLLMLLVTLAALISSGLGISSIMTTKVLERKKEIGLLKAIGGSNLAVIALFTVEISLLSILGGILGYGLGIGFANLIGQQVFGTAIAVKILVLPIILVLSIIVALLGSFSPLRIALKLEPAEVLHG
ncbi:ABC transporter permease [Selenihalanaerobacter shriftii]|uniref:Putative ABC transport system permease protein n=1 Tax=Selenihalanaerobacter shriftii TaxID=142842 RepID=A0A1T4L2R5_9FIRM|nr:ABC transporter permease [Selenihalanaerobacter shriftii]SJZ49004.1 putative ABC transport system permease protein [Selenihalanaerobacter shriftii]